jgi:hypothetical protein
MFMWEKKTRTCALQSTSFAFRDFLEFDVISSEFTVVDLNNTKNKYVQNTQHNDKYPHIQTVVWSIT